MAEQVHLFIYDLTNGMARALSPMLLGHEVEGVWHTSIVAHGVEWFFGYGVQRAAPGTTMFGQPLQRQLLGSTEVPKDLVEDLVMDLGRSSFKPEDYNILLNNCNHFSHQLAQVLVGKGIPDHILTQHEVLLRSPMGQMLMPMIMQMEGQLGNATAQGIGGAGATASTTTATAPPAAAGGAVAASASPAVPAAHVTATTTQEQPGSGPEAGQPDKDTVG